MDDLEKLNFIADVEMSEFSKELKEALLESLDTSKMKTFNDVNDAIKYLHQVGEKDNGKNN